MHVIHDIGGFLALGVGLVWAWINVALSFITRGRLSSQFACWLRVVLASLATPLFMIRSFIPVFQLYLSSERSETGGYTVFTFACLSVCVCACSRVFLWLNISKTVQDKGSVAV